MALFISNEKHEGKEWHVGEGPPYEAMRARVVTFQADGDELDVILRAMEQTWVAAVHAALALDVSIDWLTDGRIRTEPAAPDPADDGPEVEAIRNVRRAG